MNRKVIIITGLAVIVTFRLILLCTYLEVVWDQPFVKVNSIIQAPSVVI